MRGTVVSDRTYNQSNQWTRELVTDAGDDAKLRYTVRYDSIDYQSWARVEVWTDRGWQKVHEIAGAQLIGRDNVSYVSRTVSPDAFIDDLIELDIVVGVVLGLD